MRHRIAKVDFQKTHEVLRDKRTSMKAMARVLYIYVISIVLHGRGCWIILSHMKRYQATVM